VGYADLTNWFLIYGSDEENDLCVQSSPDGNNYFLTPGIIAGMSIGCVAFLALVVGGVVFCCLRRRRAARKARMASATTPLPHRESIGWFDTIAEEKSRAHLKAMEASLEALEAKEKV
jgi:hypothetical protein